MSPQFSTIIPVHNRVGLVGATLDSVFDQEFTDQEVIVVDDGSTDGTPAAVVSRYGQRVRVIRQDNKGPGAARNAGVRHATGEYVAFLDSDDLWLPWTLATYKRIVEEHHRPAFISGCAFWFRDDSELKNIVRGDLRVQAFSDFLAASNLGLFFGASWFVVRRDALLTAGGLTDRWINAEDHDLALRLGLARSFVKVESPMTFAFRRHAGTAWANNDRNYEGVLNLIEQERAGRYPGGDARRRDRRRCVTMHVRGASLGFLRAGERKRAWAFYRRTFLWQLVLGRFRYLLGFPALAVVTRLRGKSPPPPHP